MSLVNIKDSKLRDKITKDKQVLKSKLQKHFQDERMSKLGLEENVQDFFKPIIQPLKDIKTNTEKPKKVKRIKYFGGRKRKQHMTDDTGSETEVEYDHMPKARRKQMFGSQDIDMSSNHSSNQAIGPELFARPSDNDFQPEPQEQHEQHYEDELPSTSHALQPHTPQHSRQETPQSQLSPPLQVPREVINEIEELDQNARYYIKKVLTQQPGFDKTFSIRYDSDENNLMLGSLPIHFDENLILFNNRKYAGSNGLWELLTKESPQDYSQQDYRLYSSMIEASNVIFQDYDPTRRPRSSGSVKYTQIIKPLYEQIKSARSIAAAEHARGTDRGTFTDVSGRSPSLRTSHSKRGSGLKQTAECFKPNKVKPIYYNDINKIIDRLQLLVSSRQSGNNSHTNEIIEIINELLKENVIDSNKYFRMLHKLNLNNLY
jgi:hypothetical protein